MKIIKKFLWIISIVVDLFLLYEAIGCAYYAYNTPKLVGENVTYFTGMYLTAIAFLLLFVLLTIVLILRAIYVKKNKKSK